jgi:formate dehydrogenase
VYFLAALLNEILVRGGFDEVLLEKHGKNVDDLKRFVQRYSARKVAAVTGIAATTIEEIAIEIITAKSAAVYMSTGVNQSRQGMLSYWLLEMINFATGNLGRKGGVHKPNGLTNYFPPNTGTLTVDTTLGTFRLPDPIGFSALPSVVLPDLIEKGDIRALIVLGGNPLLTMGGEQAMRKACEKLELIVSIDIYRNATGEISDYVLPATDWLERMDINIHGSGMQPIPYVQYTDAMEAPAAGRRNGWWILARLAQEIGVPSPLDKNPMSEDGVDLIDSMLAARNLSIEKMRELSGHTVAFPQERRDILFEWCLQHPDKKIDCYPASFVAAGLFERCDEIFAELEREPADILKLISLRVPYMQNSWLTNTEKFRRGKNAVNPLNINESDAVRYGLFDGDQVRVFNEYGSIETQILINNDLRVGVVAMSHGYGHSKTYGLEVACQNPGANCNALMPMGIGTYEPISYMSWISGVPVEIEKTSAAFESHES